MTFRPLHDRILIRRVKPEEKTKGDMKLYRQGVRNPNHLKTMVEAARGLFEKQLEQPL